MPEDKNRKERKKENISTIEYNRIYYIYSLYTLKKTT